VPAQLSFLSHLKNFRALIPLFWAKFSTTLGSKLSRSAVPFCFPVWLVRNLTLFLWFTFRQLQHVSARSAVSFARTKFKFENWLLYPRLILDDSTVTPVSWSDRSAVPISHSVFVLYLTSFISFGFSTTAVCKSTPLSPLSCLVCSHSINFRKLTAVSSANSQRLHCHSSM
jgi:hypothetical protein